MIFSWKNYVHNLYSSWSLSPHTSGPARCSIKIFCFVSEREEECLLFFLCANNGRSKQPPFRYSQFKLSIYRQKVPNISDDDIKLIPGCRLPQNWALPFNRTLLRWSNYACNSHTIKQTTNQNAIYSMRWGGVKHGMCTRVRYEGRKIWLEQPKYLLKTPNWTWWYYPVGKFEF